MPYVVYKGLKTPNDVLEKMADYIKSRGYTVILDCVDDHDVAKLSIQDGKRLVFLSRDQDYVVHMRSANDYTIFGSCVDQVQEQKILTKNTMYRGIGMTISETYTSLSSRWYNQPNVPYGMDDEITAQCAWMPVYSVDPPIEPAPVDPAPNPPYPVEPIPPTAPERPQPFRTTLIHETGLKEDTYYLDSTGARIYYQPDIYYEEDTRDELWLHRYGNGIVIVLTTTMVSIRDDNTVIYTNQDSWSKPDVDYTIQWPDLLLYSGNEIKTANDIKNAMCEKADSGEIIMHPNLFGRDDVLSSSQNNADEEIGLPGSQMINFIRNDTGAVVDSKYYLIMTDEAWNYFLNTKYQDLLDQYEKDLAQYQKDLEEYNQKMINYRIELEQYDSKLSAWLRYKSYLDGYDRYQENYKKWEESTNTYDLYCNNIVYPEDVVSFSLVRNQNDKEKNYYQTTHLIFGKLTKYDYWKGGVFFTGSANHTMIATAGYCYTDDDIADRYILPVFSSGKVSNTYLRADIDEAPLDDRGSVLWASSGTDNETGKKLSLPLRLDENGNGKIPHYYYMQSHGRLDWGKNINTLNNYTVNMPLYFSVLRDRDDDNEYSAAGYVEGIYFCCLLNMQTTFLYNIMYPTPHNIYQVFPARGQRRGVNGFDGISIQQREYIDDF